jgi:hypothetical protein
MQRYKLEGRLMLDSDFSVQRGLRYNMNVDFGMISLGEKEDEVERGHT